MCSVITRLPPTSVSKFKEIVQSPVLQQHHNFNDNCVSNRHLPEANSLATGSAANVLLLVVLFKQ